MRFASLVIVVALCEPVLAEKPDATGRSLFEEGRALSSQGKYAEACDRFARSYELEPATGTQMNFADCQEHLGNIARAWQVFDAVAGAADREGNAVRAQYARQRASLLLPRLASLVITVARPDPRMTIVVGDRDLAPAREIRSYVNPGDVRIVASIPGKQHERTVAARAGTTASVEIPVLEPAPSTAGQPRRHTWVIAAAALGGSGLVGLSAAGLLTLSASRRYADAFTEGDCFHTERGAECTAAGLERVNAARSRANVGTGFFVGGLALVGAAVATYLLAPREPFEIAPIAGPREAGLAIGGRF